MKIRNVVWDENTRTNKVVWFGSIGRTGSGASIKHSNYVNVTGRDVENIKDYKRIEIINYLSVLKGEIKSDPKFGVSILDKPSKEILDIEILDILRTRLSLIVNVFNSKQEGRNYNLYFEATTPEGVELDITYNYNFSS